MPSSRVRGVVAARGAPQHRQQILHVLRRSPPEHRSELFRRLDQSRGLTARSESIFRLAVGLPHAFGRPSDRTDERKRVNELLQDHRGPLTTMVIAKTFDITPSAVSRSVQHTLTYLGFRVNGLTLKPVDPEPCRNLHFAIDSDLQGYLRALLADHPPQKTLHREIIHLRAGIPLPPGVSPRRALLNAAIRAHHGPVPASKTERLLSVPHTTAVGVFSRYLARHDLHPRPYGEPDLFD